MSIGLRLRTYILRRDAYRCVYCGAEPVRSYLQVDHVVPRARGGQTHPANLATACRACNRQKSAGLIDVPMPLLARLAKEARFQWADSTRGPGVTIAGIPTMYAGTYFRSRLEARWAVLFDLLGWSWTYEPIDAQGYIPDFLIGGERAFLIEVGPVATYPEYRDKASKPDAAWSDLGRDILVVGLEPMAPIVSRSIGPTDHVTAGWFGEHSDDGFWWDAGLWGQCHDCGQYGVVHSAASYVLRPCGHHQSGGFGSRVAGDWLTGLWRRAGNDTQWIARKPQLIGDVMRGLR